MSTTMQFLHVQTFTYAFEVDVPDDADFTTIRELVQHALDNPAGINFEELPPEQQARYVVFHELDVVSEVYSQTDGALAPVPTLVDA